MMSLFLVGCGDTSSEERLKVIKGYYVTLENLDQDKEVGVSYFVKSNWFKYLGKKGKKHFWLYPHMDGVYEIFSSKGSTWKGFLGSRYSFTTGEFTKRFSIARTLNKALGEKEESTEKNQYEALLKMDYLMKLHPWGKLPYYIDFYKKDLKQLIKDHNIRETSALTEELYSRVKDLETSVDELLLADEGLPGCKEYYRRILKDGYLDISVIGGNLDFQAWDYIEKLKSKLLANSAKETVLPEMIEIDRTIMDVPIKVRIRLTGASVRTKRIRRNVVNFIEGMEHSDMVFYNGHSNYLTGRYFLFDYQHGEESEIKVPAAEQKLATFFLGVNNQSSFSEKFRDIGQKDYQIFTFESCKSYEKYANPIKNHLLEKKKYRRDWAAFVGTADTAFFSDFVPRTSAFIMDVVKQKCGQDIQDHLNSVRPVAGTKYNTPALVMRNLFGNSHTFILPNEEIELEMNMEKKKDKAHLITAKGSDGKTYFSSGVFLQDNPGDIIQLGLIPDGISLYGLHSNGKVYYIDEDANEAGSAKESAVSRDSKYRYTYLLNTKTSDNKEVLYLLSEEGKLLYKTSESSLTISSRQFPGIVRLGKDKENNLYIQTDTDEIYSYDSSFRLSELGESDIDWGFDHLNFGASLKVVN
jgi:hypothetical protein